MFDTSFLYQVNDLSKILKSINHSQFYRYFVKRIIFRNQSWYSLVDVRPMINLTMLDMLFNSSKIDDNITLYSLLCLELPLHIAFKNDMLAVSNLLLTVCLHSSDTLTFLLSQHSAKLSSLPSDRSPPTMQLLLSNNAANITCFIVNTLI